MQHAGVTESVHTNGTHCAMQNANGGYGSGDGSDRDQHHYYYHHNNTQRQQQQQQQQQHSNGCVTPLPRSLSPPVLPAKQFAPQRQQSPLYPPHQQSRAISASQPGSPTLYKVSPITCESNNELPVFNPQSPYRSMAPSQSRYFNSETLSSPNDQTYRNVGHEFRASPTPSSASPPHYRRMMASPQSSTSLHSPETVLHASQQNLCLPHAIAPTDSSAPLGGSVCDATHSAAAAAAVASATESGFTAVLTNTNSPHATNAPQGGSHYRTGASAAPVGLQMSADGTSGGRTHFAPLQGAASPPAAGDFSEGNEAASASGATAEGATILPHKSAENVFFSMNGSHERRVSTAAVSGMAAPSAPAATTISATPLQRPQVRERATGSPTPPPHANVVAVAVAVPSSPPREAAPQTESAGRWVSPLRPHRAGSADASDGFQSPSSVPSSSCETPSANTSVPLLQAPSRSPAMYGVIGLPFSRAEANGPPSVSSSRSSNAARTTLTSPNSTFHASPLSSKAPAVVKPRTATAQQPPHGAEMRADARPSTVEAAAATTATRHADPAAAAAAAPITAHPRSGSGEVSSLYRRSVARNVANGTREDAAQNAKAQQTPAAASPRSTPPPPSPMTLVSPQRLACNDELALSGRAEGTAQEDGRGQQEQPQPQHIATLAPAAVVAARGRDAAKTAAPVSDVARRVERRVAHGTAGVTAPQLTPETVLPVAVQEAEARHSSTTTDATERSSSGSRLHASTSSPTSSKSSVRAAAASPLSSGRAGGRLSQTTSSLQGSVARQRRGPLKQQPQQQLPQQQQQRPSALSATYSGSAGNNSVRMTRAAAVSANSAELLPSRTNSAGERRRSSASATSVGSNKSTAPALASCAFVSSRAHLQRYIDQWRDRFEEDKTAYKEGGYLTVTPGKIVHSRYVLIQKLGWGEFSTVWLAYDTKHATLGRGATQAFVAVKVAKCRTSVQEATHYEVSLLRYIEARLPPYAAVTNIIDCFEVQGEFGTHTCMAMPLCGPNLLSVIDRVKGLRGRRSADDVRLVKEVLISVLISLHELSVLNVVHTDIKPENVLCGAVDTKLVAAMEKFCSYNKDRSHMISTEEFREAVAQQTSEHLVCLADFGLSALLEPPGSAAKWTALCPNVKPSLLAPLMRCKKNFNVTKSGVMENVRGTLIQTREYRAPEVLLGLDFTCATDIWSVGCMAFELITGNFLMDPKKKTRDAREMDVEHLAMIMQLIGPLPPEVTNIRVRNNDYYDALIGGGQPPRSSGATAAAAATTTAPTRSPPEYLHRFVDREGNFIYASRYRAYPRRSLEMELEPYLGFREARLAANFILSCLYCYDPKNRPSAKKLLSHQWFQGVGTPGKDRSGPR